MSIRKQDFLVALYIFCIVAAELMGGKVFTIGHIGSFALNASVAIFLLPIIFSVTDIFAEVLGRQKARSLIRTGIVIVAFSFLFAWLAISLPPATRFESGEAAYDAVFAKSMRFSLASLVAFALAEFTDLFIFMKIRQLLGEKALWLRNNASNFAAQFLDTAIFISLAFYDPARPFADNAPFLWSLIVPYWLLKCFMSVVETPFVYIGVAWLREDEQKAYTPYDNTPAN